MVPQQNTPTHKSAMDRIYRYQRHIYDITRPLFLPGRDALLRTISPTPGMRILEVGCGTARNLIHLAHRCNNVKCYGVDISEQMLTTASKNIRSAGCEKSIQLHLVPAESITLLDTCLSDETFDRIFFSYSLTMMPTWSEALAVASGLLSDTGGVYAVDFWDLGEWPKPVRALFSKWLSLFHVHSMTMLPEEICRRFPETRIYPLWGRYAFLAVPGK